MKAIVYRRYGGAEILESAQLPDPVPAAGQLLIRVAATSINPVDWKIASGKLRPLRFAHFPQVPGFDVAGTVAAVGAGVSGFSVGERVHARLADNLGAAAAELTVAGTNVTTQMAVGMDFATAAGLPLAGITALQGLRDGGDLPMNGANARVLVLGASGGVGHLAVQIARAAGATVIGVCSARNRDLVAGLGAHQIIDYAAPNPYADLAPCDVILDCVGNAPGPWLPKLTPTGRFASVMPGPQVILGSALNAVRARKVRPVMLKPNAADLRTLDDLFVAGKLRVVIDSRYPLSDLRGAWERSMSGRAVGKIVVDVQTAGA